MHIEAVEDGIRNEKSISLSSPAKYYPKCHLCGEEVMSYSYVRDKKYTCKGCKLEERLSDKENNELDNMGTREKKLENAIKRIGTKTRIEKYEASIKVVRDSLYHDNWFESTEEIMAAIELIRNRVKFRHRVKFGRYRADFVLDDEKIVLEIDGTVFHTKAHAAKETLRDNLIVLALDSEWEVIRITDKDLNKNITRLIPAIKAIKAKRKKLRESCGGKLPEWYTDRKI